MPLKVSDIILSLPQVAKADKVILISVADAVEYKDGKSTGNRIGTRYSCIAPANKYSSFAVKVEDSAPIITQDQIDKSAQPIMVGFEDFEGHFYKLGSSTEYAFTAKASKIVIAK